jgi:hypothetical protein
MPDFTNQFSWGLFAVAVCMVIGGLVGFIVQVIRWDTEYEHFLIFPVRLAIYALPYLLIPCLGMVVGGFMIRSERRVKRKFAKASIHASFMGLLFWITLPSSAIR